VGKSVLVDNFLYTTTDTITTPLPSTGRSIPISDNHIAVSPYTWWSGTDYKQINAAGGYIKIAFSGTHLGVDVDTSQLASISPSSVLLRAYIDGATTPIAKTLANVINGEVVFSDTLSAGYHYAIIYGGFSNVSTSRWSGNPPNALLIKNIRLSESGAILPLSDTPILPSDKKLIFYGDSITEGEQVSVAEKGYAPLLGKKLKMEYGQLGYAGGRWNVAHPAN
jgi:hypothetical protein